MFPENTLAACQAALDLEVDWIETDVRLSLDGELVIMHDSHLGRVAGVDAKLHQLSLTELQQLNVGTPENVHRIPRLEEVIEQIRGTTTKLSLQPKADCVDQIVQLIKSMHMVNQIGFNDHDLNKMSRARELLDVPIFWDRLVIDELDSEIDTAREKGFHAIVVYDLNLTREAVAAIQASGLAAGAWTVNAEARLRELVAWGVDRIYTDQPARLISIRKK